MLLAAEAVAEVSEEDATERAGSVADGRVFRNEARVPAGRAEFGEEELVEHERGGRAVQQEVIPLHDTAEVRRDQHPARAGGRDPVSGGAEEVWSGEGEVAVMVTPGGIEAAGTGGSRRDLYVGQDYLSLVQWSMVRRRRNTAATPRHPRPSGPPPSPAGGATVTRTVPAPFLESPAQSQESSMRPSHLAAPYGYAARRQSADQVFPSARISPSSAMAAGCSSTTPRGMATLERGLPGR